VLSCDGRRLNSRSAVDKHLSVLERMHTDGCAMRHLADVLRIRDCEDLFSRTWNAFVGMSSDPSEARIVHRDIQGYGGGVLLPTSGEQ
jgi:hypothetical protein